MGKYFPLGVLSLLFLLAVWSVIGYVPSRPLEGEFPKFEYAKVKLSNWLDGSYQENTEKYIKHNFGLYDQFIRLENQLCYTGFNESPGTDIVFGVENELFQKFYIESYLGQDFKGEEFFIDQLNKVKVIQDSLQRKGKNFLFILAPSKPEVTPEYLPVRYSKMPRTTTNYEVFLRLMKNSGINFIDFNGYFTKVKSTFPYRIFPQTEAHWSGITSAYACDSILKKLESIGYNNMCKIAKIEAEYLEESPKLDRDLLGILNLFSHQKYEIMPTPKITYDTTGRRKPSYLSISDSFYNHPDRVDYFFKNCFHPTSIDVNSFNLAHSTFDPNYWLSSHDLDIRAEIDKRDLVMVLITVPNLEKMSWGFFDQYYHILTGK